MRRAALGLSAWLTLLNGVAYADPFHHQSVPLGERALGMGGAFTGLANDPSAAFYNPAGLARLDDFVLSASITLNALDRQRIEDGLQAQGDSVDLYQVSRPSLPVFASFVKQLAWEKGDERRHAIAFSILTFDRRRTSFDEAIRGGEPDATNVDALTVDDERSERWYGPSYAYRFSRAFSLGVSAFLSVSRWSHSEERWGLRLMTQSAEISEDVTALVRSTRANATVYNAVFRLGAVYAFSGRLRVGAMFQPPSFRLRGSARVRERLLSINADAGGTTNALFYDDRQGGLSAHDPLPWELRLGISWAPNYKLLLALDVSAYGRRGRSGDPVLAIEEPDVTEGTDRAPSSGDLVTETWWTRRTGNVSTGLEYTIRELFILRAGAFTDLSAAPKLPPVSDVYRPSDIQRVGLTFSFGLLARGYDTSLGVAATFGWGNAMALAADDLNDPYRRVQTREQTMFVFLSGARRAAGKLAEDTYEAIRERVRSRGVRDQEIPPPELE